MAFKPGSMVALDSIARNSEGPNPIEAGNLRSIMKPGSNRKIGLIHNRASETDLAAQTAGGKSGSERSILVKNKMKVRLITNGVNIVTPVESPDPDSEPKRFVKAELAKQSSTVLNRKPAEAKARPEVPLFTKANGYDILEKLDRIEEGHLGVPGARDSENKISKPEASPNGSTKRKLRQGKKALMMELQDANPADTVTVHSELQRSQSIAMIDYFTDEVANIQNRNKINNRYFYYTSEVQSHIVFLLE